MEGDTLRAQRKALELTQQELADKLGVTRNTVNRWEAGTMKVPPYLDLALKQIEAEQKKQK